MDPGGWRHITVLADDIPVAVARVRSEAEAIAVTGWLTGRTAKRRGRHKRQPPSGFRCRSASPKEIKVFEAADLNWREARLVAVLL